ncbi:hypothetical protein BUALT_Bualt13G0067100 [Buddleja alternifolia]|uniref:F-box domain-containing protein n=1 Tax=Buddleja alternifolia TaxID=168488 RepID=A0AAV6WQR3_9LAMI|nr:hypothetical protein BUALT_Bualt13G0067100 [Buddleja alternifolia]
MMMSYEEELLPHDVIIEILSWLPPKKLLKFRSVCKSWNSTISNAKFIVEHQSHFGNLTNNNNGCIVIATRKDSGSLTSLKLSLVQDSNPEMVYDIMESKFDVTECYSIMGSCNGLFCWASFRIDDGPIQLCNPSIRWTTLVPPFPFNKNFLFPHVFRYCYGVGFDRFAIDYKVVKFIGPLSDSRHGIAAIYSVMAKSWKIVNSPVPSYLICGFSWSFFLHGFIHWLVYSHKKYKIILFDICNNVFREMQLPVINGDNNEISIYAVKNSLCLLETKTEVDSKIYHVSIMKEYGIAESWTKQFSIVLKNGISKCITLTVGGKFLCSAEKSNGLSQLILYDSERNEYINVGEAQAPTLTCANICPLVATLQLLDVVGNYRN